MAVELKDLYEEIKPKYAVRLRTEGCFQKIIEWTHIVEDFEFTKLLHGGELVFNTGLHYHSEEWLMEYIRELNEARAGGLIIALHEGKDFSQEVIDYCNTIQFPIFSAKWDTPYIDIMRLFATILLRNEQRGTNLVAAMKNAIYYPENEESYLNHFERNGFYRNMPYTMSILSCHTYQAGNSNQRLKQLEKIIQHAPYKNVVYEENDMLFILSASEKSANIYREFEKLCKKDKNVYVGIGSRVHHLQDIHKTFAQAMAAYQLTKTAINTNLLQYDELGIYKLLVNIKEPDTGQEFVKEAIGRLIAYDKKKNTDYVEILKAYFEHDCSILNTSKSLFCHKNTLTYKMNKIKDILAYDIHTNENRTKIMLALYILKMKQ